MIVIVMAALLQPLTVMPNAGVMRMYAPRIRILHRVLVVINFVTRTPPIHAAIFLAGLEVCYHGLWTRNSSWTRKKERKVSCLIFPRLHGLLQILKGLSSL